MEPKDAGLYKVLATNDLGEVTTQGHLLVKASPKFKSKMQDIACMTDQPCKVQVNIEGSPTPELKWYVLILSCILSQNMQFHIFHYLYIDIDLYIDCIYLTLMNQVQRRPDDYRVRAYQDGKRVG